MRNKSSLAQGYWKHWLNAVNEHSLHAPFVYDFYTQVIKGMASPAGFGTIESFRKKHLHSKELIEVTDYGAVGKRQYHKKISAIARQALASPTEAALLYRCAQRCEAKYTVELGTSLGISTLYLSASSRENHVYTLEGCPNIANKAKETFDQWVYRNIEQIVGNIDQTLPALSKKLPRIDLLYLDANHHYEPTIRYYQQCKEKAHEDSIFILDDIYWSRGMNKAWKEIIQDPDVSLSLDLYKMGIVLFKPLINKQHYYLIF